MTKELVILDLVGDDLQRVEQKMRSMGEGAYGPLAQAFLQLLGSGGKRLRPALALAAHRLFIDTEARRGGDGEIDLRDSVSPPHLEGDSPADQVCAAMAPSAGRPPEELPAATRGLGGRPDAKAIALAAAVETLHNATLVHDDLIDNASVRRGSTTLNAVWDKGATVLAGDYLFARAAGFAAETENIRVVQLFADTLRIICEGELRQHFSSRQWMQPKDSYYARIFAKTASLFASATRSGAILAGASAEKEQALHDYGRDLGMAFQIVDDILDYTGDESVMGKPVGGDLRQGIVTLPFFHFLESHPSPAEVVAYLDSQSNGRVDGTSEVVALVRASDAIPKAAAEAWDFARRAKSDLDRFPQSPIREALRELADFVVARHV